MGMQWQVRTQEVKEELRGRQMDSVLQAKNTGVAVSHVMKSERGKCRQSFMAPRTGSPNRLDFQGQENWSGVTGPSKMLLVGFNFGHFNSLWKSKCSKASVTHCVS